MKPLTLRSGLIFVVIAALLPIGTLSVVQALSALDYSRILIASRLIERASATAGHERDPLIIAQHTVATLSENEDVRSMGPGCRDGLKAGMLGNPSLINFARSDATGQARCSVLPFKAPVSFADDLWWKRGMTQKGFLISAPVVGEISQRTVLIGMQPLFASDGRFDGAITVALNISWLQKSLANSGKSDDATVAVTDGAGQIIVLNGNAKLPTLDAANSVGKIAEASTKDGEIWMYSSAPLYDRALYIVYAEPKPVVMATALRQVKISLILPIIAILLAPLALWFGTNRLVIKWLDSLRGLAGQFARGDYQGDPDRYANAPQEILQLSADLHAMAHVIETRDQDLKGALEVKTVLTREIHHRVKNNLQIVSSLLNLQARKMSDSSARDALNQTRARIGALAQIHRLLYEEVEDTDHGNVNIAQLMTDLTAQLRALHRHQSNIDLHCEAQSCTLPVDNAVPLSLFAVEAVTNACRHAFADGRHGNVILHFGIEDGQAQLSVTDDGIGFDANGKFKSMGHQLMTAFAHQLGGTLSIESNKPSGTIVTLGYPVGG